jgi:threonine/homoserine/homoserine lactone efflux protein
MVAAVLSFMGAAAVLVVAPGPDSLLVTRNAVRRGRRAGLATAAGTITGLLVWGAAAALGLAALLRASETGYSIVKWCGAAYLTLLGARLLISRAHVEAAGEHPQSAPGSARDRVRSAYLTGLATNILNPKVGVFFISFLPVFVPRGAPAGTTSLLFGAIFVTEGTLWLLTLVLLATRLGTLMTRPRVQRRLERLTGVVMIGFGLRVATEHR